MTTNGKAVISGQHEIKDDQIDIPCRQQSQQFITIADRECIESVFCEITLQQETDLFVIITDGQGIRA
jgi:hypothetical protein